MGKIKWILLAMLIVVLIITGVLFIKFVNNREIISVNKENELTKVYQKKMYKNLYELYENNKLILDILSIEDSGYIIFEEQKLNYCNYENVCNSSNYVYNSEKKQLYIESNINFLNQGTYDILIEDNAVELSIEKNNKKIVYLFSTAKG